MAQQVAEAYGVGHSDREILAVTPCGRTCVQGMPVRGDVVAQGLEQASQHGFAPGTGQHGKAGMQGEWRRGQCWPPVATAAECRAKHLGDGHAEEGGGHVRPVIDVGLQHKVMAGRCMSRLGQAQRIDIEQQSG
jgi:hypothetical protein